MCIICSERSDVNMVGPDQRTSNLPFGGTRFAPCKIISMSRGHSVNGSARTGMMSLPLLAANVSSARQAGELKKLGDRIGITMAHALAYEQSRSQRLKGKAVSSAHTFLHHHSRQLPPAGTCSPLKVTYPDSFSVFAIRSISFSPPLGLVEDSVLYESTI